MASIDLDSFLPDYEAAKPKALTPAAEPPVGAVYANAVKSEGLDPKWAPWLARTHQIENGGKWGGANKNSGAMGGFQFIPSTWKQTAKPGEDPYRPQDNANNAARYLKQNIARYTQLVGKEPQPWEMYMMHQQGPGGYPKLLANLDKRAGDLVGDAAIRQNGGNPDAPARDFLTLWQNKFNKTPQALGVGADTLPQSLGGGKLKIGPVDMPAPTPIEKVAASGILDKHLPDLDLPKISENIAADIAPGAKPVSDQEGVLQTGGKPFTPNAGAEWSPARAGGSTFLSGLGPELSAAAQAAKAVAGEIQRGVPWSEAQAHYKDYYEQARTAYKGAAQTSAEEQPGLTKAAELTGAVGQGVLAGTGANALLSGAARAVPALARPAAWLAGTGGAGTSIASGAVQGAAGAAAQDLPRMVGNALAPGSVEPLPEGQFTHDLAWGAGLGAPIGGATGWLGAKATSPLRATANPAVARAAQDMADRGVQVPGTAMINQPAAKSMAAAITGTPDSAIAQRFTQQLGATFGADREMARLGATGLTREVMDAVQTRLGRQFDAFANKAKNIPIENTNADRVINDVAHEIGSRVPAVSRDVYPVLNAIQDAISPNGTMTAKQFRQLTNSESDLYALFKNSTTRPYAQRVMDAMYGALGDALPNEAAALNEARRQYANFITVKPASVKAGPHGILTGPTIADKLKNGPPDLRPFGDVAAMMPRITAEGMAKEASSWLPHGIRGLAASGIGAVGGGAFGAATAGAIAPEALMSLSASPLGIAAGIGGAAAGHFAKKLYGNYLNSPGFTQQVIGNTLNPSVHGLVNPFVPLGRNAFTPEFGGT